MAKQITKKNTFLLAIGGVPVAADVVTTSNDIFINPKPKTGEYKDVGGGVGGATKAYAVGDYVTADVTVETRVRGSGTEGVAPEVANLLKICGLSETIDADVSVTYAPALAQNVGTAKAYLDGYYRTLSGVMANMTFKGNIGEQASFSFALKSFTTTAPTAEANPAVVLDDNIPLIVTSVSAVTIGGASIACESFEFDLGNDIQEAYGVGTKEFYLNDFVPTVKITAIKTKGNEAHWSDLIANNHRAIVITLGDVAGNIVELSIPTANPKDVSESDQNGKVIYEQTFQCEGNGTNNFSLTFK